jgi:N-acetyl-gamma-glutamyl-phosphate reductase
VDSVDVAVVGATGYTGAELLRLIHGHPRLRVTRIIGQSRAGERVSAVLPSLAGLYEGDVAAFDADDVAGAADVAFAALPHGASAGVVAELRERGVRVMDLSADFRLDDPVVYAEWYGEHLAPSLFGKAVYGLVELTREELDGAELVAVPGCYPTASILGLAPLVAEGLVETDGLIIDAKSGASGAGRKPGLGTHLPEVGEGIRAYKAAGKHRHTPEIEMVLSRLAGDPIRVTFTPHLVPMTRGILATAYANATTGVTAERCAAAARARYEHSPSVVVLDPGVNPDTTWVRGSNRAFVSYTHDARTDRVLAQTVIDNLVKGAAGQAIQCLNVAMGWPEAEGLGQPAAWP